MSHSDSELNKCESKKKHHQLQIDLKCFKPKKKSFLISKNTRKYLNEQVLNKIRTVNDLRLLQAVCINNTESIQEQIKHGADPNIYDQTGRGALHIAASRGYTDAVKILLDQGANPNQIDILNNTPLHLAACNHNLQIISMLLKAGADVSKLDMYGKNPVQIAESKLQLLHKSWRSGSIETLQVRKELELIVDILISVQSQSEQQANLPDLEMMKLSLKSGEMDNVDDQMCKLLNQLQGFKL